MNTDTLAQPAKSTNGREALDELHAIHGELAALRQLFNDFARTFLDAKFPHGKPVDRWARR